MEGMPSSSVDMFTLPQNFSDYGVKDVAQSVKVLPTLQEALISIPRTHKLCVAAHERHPRPGAKDAERPGVQGHPYLQIHNEFEASLEYVRPRLKKLYE